MVTKLTPQKMCIKIWSPIVSPAKAKIKCKGGKAKIQKAITAGKAMQQKARKLKVPLQKCTESLMKKGSKKADAAQYCKEVLKLAKPKVHGTKADVKVCAGMRRQDDKSLAWSAALHLCQGTRAKKYIQSRQGINKPIGNIFPKVVEQKASNLNQIANQQNVSDEKFFDFMESTFKEAGQKE